MEDFEGTLDVKGTTYRIAGVLEVRVRDGIKQWSGYFVAPEDSNLAAVFDTDEPHQLKLDDTRSGDVVFSTIDRDESGTTLIDFKGSGPLK